MVRETDPTPIGAGGVGTSSTASAALLRLTPSFRGYKPSSEASSRAMRGNRKRDTKPEKLLRRQLWRLGLRFRKNVSSLPGQPDIVFPTEKIAVFCDGDFWHGRNWADLKSKL